MSNKPLPSVPASMNYPTGDWKHGPTADAASGKRATPTDWEAIEVEAKMAAARATDWLRDVVSVTMAKARADLEAAELRVCAVGPLLESAAEAWRVAAVASWEIQKVRYDMQRATSSPNRNTPSILYPDRSPFNPTAKRSDVLAKMASLIPLFKEQ